MNQSVSGSDRFTSIIILNYNGLSLNREAFLDAIRCALDVNLPSKEVILVDNCSTDGSLDYVANHFSSMLKIVALKKNLGHAGGMNAGARASSSDATYLVFVNNDVKYDPAVISSLVKFLDENPRVAACSCLEVFPHRDKNFCGSHYDLGLFNVAPREGCDPFLVTTVENLIVVRKEVFAMLGGFDECLLNVFDEQEFCLRIWMSGYSVACYPGVSFIHSHTLPVKETPNRWALDLKNKYLTILKLYSIRGILGQLSVRILRDLYRSITNDTWRKNGMYFRIIRLLIEIIASPCYIESRRRFSSVKKYDEKDLYRLGIIKS